jgi:hypothetical protein
MYQEVIKKQRIKTNKSAKANMSGQDTWVDLACWTSACAQIRGRIGHATAFAGLEPCKRWWQGMGDFNG